MRLNIVLLVVWLSIVAFVPGSVAFTVSNDQKKEPKELRIYFKHDWFGTTEGKTFVHASCLDSMIKELKSLYASVIPVPQFLQLHDNAGKGSKIPVGGFLYEKVDDFGSRFGGDHSYDDKYTLGVELDETIYHVEPAWLK
ncbi:hypothetical protein FB446DRAFT_771431 [Lentinula raphanica]|nr:hypothetical protein C8R42DRAFT_323813 [Lentinula raphanica]KAJ3773920.1 hypothetical protein FB446DRAFT_771431 [Lentinula raphanica]